MLNKRTIRIPAVDDHPLLRGGIAGVINSEEDLQFVGCVAVGSSNKLVAAQLAITEATAKRI